MASAKGEGNALTSNSNPTNDATETNETTVLSTVEMNIEKAIVVTGSTDGMEIVEEENDEVKTFVAANNKENEEHEGKEEEENVIAEEESNEENSSEEDAGEGEEEEEEEENVGEGKEEENVGERKEEEKEVGEKQNEKEVEVKAEEKGRKPRKRNKKKVVQKGSEIVAVDGDKPESSNKKKASKRVEGMGMIFMCSSKTKTDCFHYKVLGLPAGKKDQVKKIYKGMRLFLFDIDLRLMYGIFKAAAPGGYNIEPKAFKSAFPSQVRFTVMSDCLPLAEEKFKKVLKENYYSRNKFDCQLNSEQVKKLCKLFTVASKGPISKAIGKSRKAETHASEDQERRKRRERDEERHPVLRREHRYQERPVIYEKEVFASPVAPLRRQPHFPPPAPTYVYERPLERDLYLRDPVLEHHGLRYVDSEPRRRDEIGVRDPYIIYREAPSYRDTVYSAGRPLHYEPSAALPLEHRYVGRDYHSAAGQQAEYHLSGGSHPEYRAAEPMTRYYPSSGSVPEPTTRYYPSSGSVPEPTTRYYPSSASVSEYPSGRTIYRY